MAAWPASHVPAAPGFRVGRNIIVANGAANALTGGDCKFGPADNYISAGPDAVKFVSNLDLHLTAASPKTNPIIVDDIGGRRRLSDRWPLHRRLRRSAAPGQRLL